MKPERAAGIRSGEAETVLLALPADANSIGSVFGGRILQIMDMVATIAARRHTGTRVATVAVQEVRFLKPIRVGQVVVCKAKVNRVFGSSMEVGVKVWAEDTYAKAAYHACSGYLTFVALGEDGRPIRVADVALETEEERRRWTEAGERRRLRAEAERKGRESMAHGEE
ncbi:MAG: acyl-CoA thioesterase [bacterium]|jgi:acyl-CoA hydrolase|nr:acyl-CoA thioesterase [candidate division KSB1 bacterium]MDH7559411.1 acyl-CoA thioesterase [bacterium]